MQESDTYPMIVDEGKKKGIREIILLQVEGRFGPPDESVKACLNHIADLNHLKYLVRRTPKAANWQELLDTP